MIQTQTTSWPLARSALVLASAAAGLAAPIDGITADLQNVDRVASDTARAKRLGFTGKLCVHPAQVTAINQGLDPTDHELDWAASVLSRMQGAEGP